MDIIKLNVAIILPDDIEKRSISISKKLKNEETYFLLDGQGFIPHITLYFTDFPEKNLDKIISETKRTIEDSAQFEVKFSENKNYGWGYFGADFERTKGIVDLHKNLLEKLNPLREGYIDPIEIEKSKGLPLPMRDSIQKYAYMMANDLYSPHITFAKLKDTTKDVLNLIPNEDLSFTAKEIGIFERGDHGTCRKLLYKFDLI